MGAVVFLTAAVVAPTLFVRSASDAALRRELQAVDADAFASTSSGVRATWRGVLPETHRRTVIGAVDRLPGFGHPSVAALGTITETARGTRAVVRVGGRLAPSTLYYREGALDLLDPQGTAGSGVWLDEEVADILGVAAGEEVVVTLERAAAMNRPPRPRVRVAGVFERAEGSALPAVVAAEHRVAARDLPWNPDRPGEGSPIVLADVDTIGWLALEIGEELLWTADADLAPDPSPQAAARAARALQRLADAAFDDGTPVANATFASKPQPTRLELASGLPDIVVRSQETAAVARDQSVPFAGAGVVLGGVVVCTAGALLSRSRRVELQLMSGLGMGSAEVAVLAALEAVVPAVVGVLLGYALVWRVVDAVGPPGKFRDGAMAAAAGRAGLAVLLSLVLLGGCAWLAAWLTNRRAASGLQPARRRLPWEAALLTATVTAGVAVVASDVEARQSSPLAVVFPTLLAATVALLVLRLIRRTVARLLGRSGPGSPAWLAAQRSRVVARDAAAAALTVAVGLAVFAYALAVHRGVTQGSEDKVAAVVGARTVVEMGAQLGHPPPPRLPLSPLPRSSVVWRNLVTLPPTFGAQPILAVDTRTFASVADWGATGRLDTGRDHLEDLRPEGKPKRGAGAPPVPVLLADGTGQWAAGDVGTMNGWDEWTVPFRVVAVVPAFPGSESEMGNTTIVVDAAQMFAEIPAFDPTVIREEGGVHAGVFRAELWSAQGSATVAAGLERRRLLPGNSILREEGANRSRLLAASWSSGYVLALGAAAALLGVLVAMLLALRLAARDRVPDLLLARMGFTVRDLTAARTWELAGVVGSAVVAALAAALVLAGMPTMVDPDVSLPPETRPILQVQDVALMLLLGVALVIAAGAVAARRTRRTSAGEVMRGNV